MSCASSIQGGHRRHVHHGHHPGVWRCDHVMCHDRQGWSDPHAGTEITPASSAIVLAFLFQRVGLREAGFH
jgi:hypothetical protein